MEAWVVAPIMCALSRRPSLPGRPVTFLEEVFGQLILCGFSPLTFQEFPIIGHGVYVPLLLLAQSTDLEEETRIRNKLKCLQKQV